MTTAMLIMMMMMMLVMVMTQGKPGLDRDGQLYVQRRPEGTRSRQLRQDTERRQRRRGPNVTRLGTRRGQSSLATVMLTVMMEFHGTDTDTDTDILAGDFPIQLATSRTRTTILADFSADLSDTCAFPCEDVR